MPSLYSLVALLCMCLFTSVTAVPWPDHNPGHSSSSSSSSSSSKHTTSTSSKMTTTKTTTTSTSTSTSTSTKTSATPTCTLDTYDNLSPGVDPLANPVGLYDGLQYTNFLVGATLLNATEEVATQSPPNYAFFRELELGPAEITINYANSTYKSFDLVSFFFACVLADGVTVTTVAQGCTISVTGYLPNGTMVGEAPFAFSAAATGVNNMSLAVLPPQYRGIATAEFGVAASATTPDTTTVLVDNLEHCMYAS